MKKAPLCMFNVHLRRCNPFATRSPAVERHTLDLNEVFETFRNVSEQWQAIHSFTRMINGMDDILDCMSINVSTFAEFFRVRSQPCETGTIHHTMGFPPHCAFVDGAGDTC